jgi:hypothetical protein
LSNSLLSWNLIENWNDLANQSTTKQSNAFIFWKTKIEGFVEQYGKDCDASYEYTYYENLTHKHFVRINERTLWEAHNVFDINIDIFFY